MFGLVVYVERQLWRHILGTTGIVEGEKERGMECLGPTKCRVVIYRLYAGLLEFFSQFMKRMLSESVMS